MVVLTGRCTCGDVTFTLKQAPMYVHCCHCTSCQRETGSAFAVNALIESSQFEVVNGTPECVLTPSESGRGQPIWRCRRCRVALWSNYGGAGDKINFVRVGTLDKPHDLKPDMHIFTRSKVPWVVLPPDQKSAAVYYDTEKEWPAASYARRLAALKSR